MPGLLIAAVILAIVLIVFGKRLLQRATSVPLASPRFAMLDLSRGAAAALIEEDRAALRDVLGE